MRAEKRKKYLIYLLVVLLVLAVPLTYIRVLAAARHLTVLDLQFVTDECGSITDRTGTVLYNGQCVAEDSLGNLVGNGGLINNSLANRYSDVLMMFDFNPLVGLDSLESASEVQLQTTLMDLSAQQRIQEIFGQIRGAVFAYNYQTGQVYTAMSLPSSLTEGVAAGSFFNGCLSGRYTPGSTMKVVTSLCALAQDSGLADFTYTCTGEVTLPDGNTITCHGVHGSIGMTQALGYSCNCYMAGLIQQLDVEKTTRTLEKLGIFPRGTEGKGELDRLSYALSTTGFYSAAVFQDVWSMIGQGDSLMNPVRMAMIAGAIANDGLAAEPYLVQTITEKGETLYAAEEAQMTELVSPETAQQLRQIWGAAVEDHYRGKNAMDSAITFAKTGTAQIISSQTGAKQLNRLLLGVIEESHTAFFIVVEDVSSGSDLIFQVANALVRYLPKTEGGVQ